MRDLCGIMIALAVVSVGGAAARADSAEQFFNSLYGQKFEQVTATPDKSDDLALAIELLAAARKSERQPEVLVLLCEKAYELCKALPESWQTAVEAMNYLAETVPHKKQACQENVIALHKLRYDRSRGYEQEQAAADLIDALLAAAETKAESGSFDEAVALAQRAFGFARGMGPYIQEKVQARLREFQAREKLTRKIQQLEGRLNAASDDVSVRNALIEAYVVDLDAPQRAVEIVKPTCDSRLRTYVPLACKDPKELADAACLELADWYKTLAAKASRAGRLAMLQRARGYYKHYLSVHKAEDTDKLKAELALGQVEKQLSELGETIVPTLAPAVEAKLRPMDNDTLAFVKHRDSLPAEQQLQVMLRELRRVSRTPYIEFASRRIADGKIVELNLSHTIRKPEGGPDIHHNVELRNIDPLYGLPLTKLYLRECTNLRGDLCALAGMKLTHLDLWKCESLTSVNGIQGMPLETLVLPPAGDLRGDLSILRGIGTLTSLTLDRCDIRSLNGIQGMKLKQLWIIDCKNLKGLDGIEGMPLEKLALWAWDAPRSLSGLNRMGLERLTRLEVQGCPNLVSLKGIEGLPLTALDLRGCRSLSGDLSLLKGMKLTSLHVGGCGLLRSLNGIQGMKLRTLQLGGSGIASLVPLRGMELTSLDVGGCVNLRDLRGLEGMPLVTLGASRCRNLRDISSLRGCPKLGTLSLSGCGNLTSLRGIEKLPLVRITVEACPKLKRSDYLLLTKIPTLAVVNTGDEKRDEEILARCKGLRGWAQ